MELRGCGRSHIKGMGIYSKIRSVRVYFVQVTMQTLASPWPGELQFISRNHPFFQAPLSLQFVQYVSYDIVSYMYKQKYARETLMRKNSIRVMNYRILEKSNRLK